MTPGFKIRENRFQAGVGPIFPENCYPGMLAWIGVVDGLQESCRTGSNSEEI